MVITHPMLYALVRITKISTIKAEANYYCYDIPSHDGDELSEKEYRELSKMPRVMLWEDQGDAERYRQNLAYKIAVLYKVAAFQLVEF